MYTQELKLRWDNFYSLVLLSILSVVVLVVVYVWRGDKSADPHGVVQRERRCLLVVGVLLGVLPTIGMVSLASVEVALSEWSFDKVTEQVSSQHPR